MKKLRGQWINCLRCSKPFYAYPYQVAKKKLCSFKCKSKGEYRNCLICEKSFYALPGSIKRGWGRFCSSQCAGKSHGNAKSFGKYAIKGCLPPKTAFKKGIKSFERSVKDYKALHHLINKKFGQPSKCEFCGITKTGRQILCAKCHQRYDYENFGKRKEFYQ